MENHQFTKMKEKEKETSGKNRNRRERNNGNRNQKAINKMAIVSPYISIITLNVWIEFNS